MVYCKQQISQNIELCLQRNIHILDFVSLLLNQVYLKYCILGVLYQVKFLSHFSFSVKYEILFTFSACLFFWENYDLKLYDIDCDKQDFINIITFFPTRVASLLHHVTILMSVFDIKQPDRLHNLYLSCTADPVNCTNHLLPDSKETNTQ